MADGLLGDLLRQVSRSFYLSLAILPRPLREPIGLAYLLARAADTVADTRLIVREERVRHVETLRRASGRAAAGCVGPFWTALHVAHRPRLRHWDVRDMSEKGVSFGKALQMTNVLRDVPSDLRNGRCYLPAAELAALGLVPKDLLEPGAAARVRPLYRRLLATTLDHYDVAWRYTLAIPRLEWRMRLACAWPLLIGLATLVALAARPGPLAATIPIKIPRRVVRALLARSVLTVWSDAALAADPARLRGRIAL